MPSYFQAIEPIRYRGHESCEALAFRHYDKDRLVLGKRMEDQLRFAVRYWHNICRNGADPFGLGTFERPWFEGGTPMDQALRKADAAFEFMAKLGAPYYCFHDRDVAPEGATPRESHDNFRRMVGVLGEHQQRSGLKLLWGTAKLLSHRSRMAGAASNPDPEVFAMAALQVRDAMNATHELGGQNCVLRGGREGHETLPNTELGQELDELGRLLNLAVEHKHRIGFKGTILIEPKPREPSKHQHDFDVATVYGFLVRHGLEKEVKVNIEAKHARLSGHSFEHEIARAGALGILGSLNMNRGDPQLGWDTDQSPNNVPETALALYQVLRAGGLGTGGLHFDAKVCRQSLEPQDLFHGHVGALDVCAQALLLAERRVLDGRLEQAQRQRCAGWAKPMGCDILEGPMGLNARARQVLETDEDVRPVSGRQEQLENLVNQVMQGRAMRRARPHRWPAHAGPP